MQIFYTFSKFFIHYNIVTFTYQGPPAHCTSYDTTSDWSTIFPFSLFMSNRDYCREYYKSTMVHPIWEINPLMVNSLNVKNI